MRAASLIRGAAGILALLAVVLTAAPAAAEKRVALVIGNAAYRNTVTLKNPVNDAGDLARSLGDLGFEVVLGTDLDFQGMRRSLSQFSTKIQGADLALFFYAGHGVQVD